VGLVLTVTYTALLYGMYVPDWEYVVMSPDTTLKNFMVIKLINMSNENFRSFYIHAESIHTCFKMFFVLFMSYILPHPGEVWGEG
jgi:hypothetical protein